MMANSELSSDSVDKAELRLRLKRSMVETQRQQRIRRELRRLEHDLNSYGLPEDALLAELAFRLQTATQRSISLEMEIQSRRGASHEPSTEVRSPLSVHLRGHTYHVHVCVCVESTP